MNVSSSRFSARKALFVTFPSILFPIIVNYQFFFCYTVTHMHVYIIQFVLSHIRLRFFLYVVNALGKKLSDLYFVLVTNASSL